MKNIFHEKLFPKILFLNKFDEGKITVVSVTADGGDEHQKSMTFR
jgi:hypothetical protein